MSRSRLGSCYDDIVSGDAVTVIGWDIGGVNTKAAALVWPEQGAPTVRTAGRYFEVWRAPDQLTVVLREVIADLKLEAAPRRYHVITMTAELSDVFRTKSEGVLSVFDAVGTTFTADELFALRLDEQLVSLDDARREPRSFAAANWLAGALYIASQHPTCLWIDCGSTTTDVIPIVDGAVRVEERTDTDRLINGELVYTGALRTPLGAVAAAVSLRGRLCRTSPEYFASTADVHLVLRHISSSQYTCPTADGRGITIDAALERIARTVCADRDSVTSEDARALARAFDDAQLTTIGSAVLQVLSRFANEPPLPVVATGSGAFIAREIARRLRLPLLETGPHLAPALAEILPCYAAATLLARRFGLSLG